MLVWYLLTQSLLPTRHKLGITSRHIYYRLEEHITSCVDYECSALFAVDTLENLLKMEREILIITKTYLPFTDRPNNECRYGIEMRDLLNICKPVLKKYNAVQLDHIKIIDEFDNVHISDSVDKIGPIKFFKSIDEMNL